MATEPVVHVVEDDEAVRESLQWLLESAGLKVREYDSAAALLQQCDGDLAGCLILDVRLPGMNGLELQERLAERQIQLPAIVITGHGDVPLAVRAMKNGAVDFLEKPFSDQMLLDRVREALASDEQRREADSQRRRVRERFERLTPRERQVMRRVTRGQLNKQIAADLNLSSKTIEVHRAHVMQKMQASTFADLVRMSVVVEDMFEADEGVDTRA